MKIKKDKRTDAEFGSENLPSAEYEVVNGDYSGKTKDGYSWIHIQNKEGKKFMVGGTTLHKMEKIGLISGTKTEFNIPKFIKFGVKNWEVSK